MGAYRYKALNADGRLIKGVLEADSERHLRGQLRAQNLRPIQVIGTNASATKEAGQRFRLFKPGL